MRCLENGKVEVEGEVLDAEADLEFKLTFSKDGDHWEAESKPDRSLVVAVDCTQDAATMAAGMSGKLIGAIQRLRKEAGLGFKDTIEVFFEEEGSLMEEAIQRNASVFVTKFKGAVPLPARFAPKWSVAIKQDTVQMGGTSVVVKVCRPAIAARDDLDEAVALVLQTSEPADFEDGQEFKFSLDGNKVTFQEGIDFWKSTIDKVRATEALSWV